jgi:hypothetical protein
MKTRLKDVIEICAMGECRACYSLIRWLLLLSLAFALGSARAEHWTPPEALLDAIRYVESSNGRMTYGDNGRSLGDYQISEAAWLDVNGWRKSRGLPIHSYYPHVWNPTVSRGYAADYLRILHARLESRLRRCPSWGEMYAAYNMGFAAFARCQFRLARVNPTTARKSLQIQAAAGGRYAQVRPTQQ